MGIESWSTTAGSNNSASPNGAPEGMAPSGVNDTIRQVMASVRSWYEDAQWINYGHTPTRVDADTFTVATDLTAIYHAGRRVKATGSATGYATIASSSYSNPTTTVNVTMDSGSLPTTLSSVYVGAITADDTAAPAGDPAVLLAALLTVDGAGSGLDADLLDGVSGAGYAAASHDHASITGNAATATTATAVTGTVGAAATVNGNLVGYLNIPRRTSGWAAGECLAVSSNQTLNTSDMAEGRVLMLYNDSGSTITLLQGSGVTLRKGGTATTGNLTVAVRGVAGIWCNSSTEAIARGDVS